MRFFPIVPIKYLESMAGLSNSQMVIAPWLANRDYLEFYRKRFQLGDFIILDNGACGNEKTVQADELMYWYGELGGCNVLVIPDCDGGENLKLFERFLSEYSDCGVALMAVPHSMKDLSEMIRVERVDYIGLNRDMELEPGGRARIIELYKDYGKTFHLLGIRKSPISEVLPVRRFGNLVLGVDSSLPYRILSRGRTLAEYRPYPAPMNLHQNNLSEELHFHCVEELEAFIALLRDVS